MGQSVEQMKDRIFSFQDMKLGLSPIASTSGKNNIKNIYQQIFLKTIFFI
jgi:hypothetical protein